MLKRKARVSGGAAIGVASLLFLAGLYFGSSRDFGLFLVSILILPVLYLVALIAAIWAVSVKTQFRQASISSALIALTPLAYLCSYGAAQQIRFFIWAPAHASALAAAASRNGVIRGWDSWGLAGADTFSYLAADTKDALGSTFRAHQWTKEIGQTCGLWRAQRVWPKLYIVTTFTNCPYDGVPPAEPPARRPRRTT